MGLSIYTMLFISILVLFSIARCSHPTKKVSDQSMIDLPADFISFYSKFHTDSSFQMNSILFPIPSKSINSDTNEAQYWTLESWKLHKSENLNNKEFIHVFDLWHESLIIEYQRHRLFPFLIERRWSKSQDSWSLIYYGIEQGKL